MWKTDEEWFQWWEEFYNLCQSYRHAPLTPQDRVCEEYKKLTEFVAKGIKDAGEYSIY